MPPRRWFPRFVTPLLHIALALVALPLLVARAAPDAPGLPEAVAWLVAQQGADGGFAGYSGKSDPGATTDAIVALGAARQAGLDADRPLGAALEWLANNDRAYAAAGPGQRAKLTLAAVAAGIDPRAFGDIRPAATPAAETSATPTMPGVYGDDLYDHALVVLALAASGEPVPPEAIDVLRRTQQAGGGWAADGSPDAAKGDSNTTATIVQALVAAGHGDDPMIAKALAALKGWQTADGGFAFAAADPLVADANSTALGVQAILAAGQDPAAADWRNAAAALAQFQNPSGAFRYMDTDRSDNLFATLQAIPALARQAAPVGPRCGAATPVALPAGFAAGCVVTRAA